MQLTTQTRRGRRPWLALLFLTGACAPQRQTLARPGAAEVRYLALGDSFTIGTGAGPELSFPARLAARLRAAGRSVQLRNPAVNGYTTQDLIDDELPQLRDFAPTLVTVAIGANDIVRGSDAARYRAQVRRILSAIIGGGVDRRRVFALPQPAWSQAPVAAHFGARGDLAGQISAFNQILAEEAHAAGARYVDLSPLMKQQAQAGRFAADGLHPSAAAYDEWAAALLPELAP